MNRRLARVVASKWFALPLLITPFAYLIWCYQAGSSSIELIPPALESNASVESIKEEQLPFTVSDEEFRNATSGVPGGESDGANLEDEIPVGANLNETFTDATGSIAIGCLIIVLCLTPLRRVFPHTLLVSALNRHRRQIGLACFFYACLHFTLYFDGGLERLFDEWGSILYVQAGLAAFLVLLVMALTSSDWAVRKLGKHRWKKLHRLVYLLIPILFYHKGWAGKGGLGGGDEQVIETLIWFSPLFALQAARIFVYFRKRNSVPTATGGA